MNLLGFTAGLPFGIALSVAYIILLLQNILGIVLNIPLQLVGMLTPIFNLLSFLSGLSVAFSLFLLFLLVVVHALLVLVPYLGAGASIGTATGTITANGGEWFSRGAIMGINWPINFVFAGIFLFGSDPIFFSVIMGMQLLAIIPALSSNLVVQGFIGWSGWLMPMGWLATSIGFVVFILDRIIALIAPPTVTLPATFPIPALAGGVLNPTIVSITVSIPTGCIVTHGGFFTINTGAYNLGNFLFVHTANTGAAFTSVVLHETGHTLNVSSMGSIFHFIGAVDENIIQTPATSARAYAEMAAESHRKAPGSTFIDLW